MLPLWVYDDGLDKLAVSLGLQSVYGLFRFLAEKYHVSDSAEKHFSLYLKFGHIPFYITRELGTLHGDN